MRGEINVDPVLLRNRLDNVEGLARKMKKAKEAGDIEQEKKYQYHYIKASKSVLDVLHSTHVWYR